MERTLGLLEEQQASLDSNHEILISDEIEKIQKDRLRTEQARINRTYDFAHDCRFHNIIHFLLVFLL